MTPGALVDSRLVSRTREIADPGDLLAHLGHGGLAWLVNGAGFVTAGVAGRIRVEPGPGQVAEAAGAVAAVLEAVAADDPLGRPGTGPLAVGAFPFANDRPAELVVPARVTGRSPDGTAWVTETEPAECPALLVPGDPGEPPSRFAVSASRSREEWVHAVEAAREAIQRGELEKVVLARDVLVEADRPFDIPAALGRLRETHPSCFTFATGSLVGATPELLVRRRGNLVESRPVAGTAPRGAATSLVRSQKELAEHRVVVEGVAKALAPACSSLVVPREPEVVELADLLHLGTPVSGRLDEPAPSALALAGRLHPTAAVGGSPLDQALRLIRELEGMDRGGYAGPLGWVDASGDGEWAVALRCAEVDGPRARLFAGAGIVAGSDPDAEWSETQRKLEAMLVALVRP